MTQLFFSQILYFEQNIFFGTLCLKKRNVTKRLPPPKAGTLCTQKCFCACPHHYNKQYIDQSKNSGQKCGFHKDLENLNKIICLGTLCIKKHNVTVSVFLHLLLPTFPPHVTALQKHSLVPLGRNYVLAS